MKGGYRWFFILGLLATGAAAQPSPSEKLLAEARQSSAVWERLAYLCDRIGARPAWSPAYAAAASWAKEQFLADGQEKVRLEPVEVPTWRRGKAEVTALAPFPKELPALALGGSVGTPPEGVEGKVVVVRGLEEVGPQVRGAIVLYAAPMEKPADYGPGSRVRSQGASRAARFGARAVLLRSLGTRSLATPHTGMLHYEPEVPPIPAAAITSEDADWIARLAAQGVEVRLRLRLDCSAGEKVVAHNVVAEIVGREKPEEIVLLGAHLDSWDVGQGAHDDGAGVVQVMEALRLIRQGGLRPKRTIRAVLFANEEFGVDGGKAYAAAHGQERHVAAVEADMGGFAPKFWGASGSAQQLAWFLPCARPTGLPVRWGGGGADIAPLAAQGVLTVGLVPEAERYFDYHHTHADTLDKVNPQELREGAGVLAVLAWELAQGPEAPWLQ